MYTLQEVKDNYYYELSMGYTDGDTLEDYMKDNYTQIYDEFFDMIGYEMFRS